MQYNFDLSPNLSPAIREALILVPLPCSGKGLFNLFRDKIECVIFSPDDFTLASASEDRTIKLWKKDGTLLKTLSGHDDKIRSIDFSADGKTIVSASDDQTVILWDLNEPLNLTLEELLNRACKRLNDYLKTNPNVSEDDRHICEKINQN